MLRGCGLFHCVLGGYVERLWPLSLCFGRLCREVVVSFIVFWEVMLREVVVFHCGLFHCVLGGPQPVLKGCGLFHCVMGGYLGGYVERLWSLSLCFGRLC